LEKEDAAMDGTPKATKTKARDAKTKIAQNRMSVLELATSFYEWKRRFWV